MSNGNAADRVDPTLPGKQCHAADGIPALPAGLVRLSDPNVRATGRDGPSVVARLLAYLGRVTLFHGREKTGKSTLLRTAVGAVTRGAPFLDQPTIPGRVLWVGEEAVSDVKKQLTDMAADLDKVFFIRLPNTDRNDASSLPRLVALVRPVWVIIDTWQHYLKVHRVTSTAGPGEQALLLGDVTDLAQQHGAAVTVSHHNQKNRNEYRDSTALGGGADMIVSLGRAEQPTVRRLDPTGRWHLDPLAIRWQPDVGYEVVEDAEQAEPSNQRPPEKPIDERVLLYLSKLEPDARPNNRQLAAALPCQGRRYDELSSALERLVGEESIDRAQRPGSTSSRDRGYALTPAGRLRAEALREACSASRQQTARSNGTTVSEHPAVEVSGSGNGTQVTKLVP